MRFRVMLVSLVQLICDSSVDAVCEELQNLKHHKVKAERSLKLHDSPSTGIEGVRMEMRRFKE